LDWLLQLARSYLGQDQPHQHCPEEKIKLQQSLNARAKPKPSRWHKSAASHQCIGAAKNNYDLERKELISSFAEPMPRLTITLDERDHLALKLLAIRDGKRLGEAVDDAVKHYLNAVGAYGLSIRDSASTNATDKSHD